MRFRLFRARHYYERDEVDVDERVIDDGTVTIRITMGAVPSRLLGAQVSLAPALEAVMKGEPVPTDLPLNPPPEDWLRPLELYTCIEIAHVFDAQAVADQPDRRYLWFNWGAIERLAEESQDDARRVFDTTTAALLRHFGSDIINFQLYQSRVFVEAEDKPIQPLPIASVGQVRAVAHRPEVRLPRGVLQVIPEAEFVASSDFETVGRWVSLALAESDGFKRLMWAVAGLEVISRLALPFLRPTLLQKLSWGYSADRTIAGQRFARDAPLAGDQARRGPAVASGLVDLNRHCHKGFLALRPPAAQPGFLAAELGHIPVS